jgi:membrane fusion protein (multidrug efflux system)
MMIPLITGIFILAAVILIGLHYHMLKQMVIMIVFVLITIGIIGYFKYQGFQKFVAMKEGMSHMKQTVSTTKASLQEWTLHLQAVGSIRAAKGVDVANEISGIVEEIHFNSGEDVKAGDILLSLRAQDEIAKLQTLEAAQNIAEINFIRDKKQMAAQAVSRATLDNDEATLQGAKAKVLEQKAIVEKKIIRAPFYGHLGIRNIDVGQYINAGSPIVTLQQLDPLYLDFTMSQQSLAQLRVGQKIIARSDTYPDRVFEGKIAAINPKVDINTRNVQVRAELSNSEHLLLPGMYAKVEIVVGEPKQVVTLPQTAITYNPYGNTVFIVKESEEPQGLTVVQQFVTVGEARGDQVQILQGVNEGDIIVSAGQLKLQNGSAITVNNSALPKDDANPKPVDN